MKDVIDVILDADLGSLWHAGRNARLSLIIKIPARLVSATMRPRTTQSAAREPSGARAGSRAGDDQRSRGCDRYGRQVEN